MLVFEEREKPEFPEKNPSKQNGEPTNSVNISRRVRESNPGHIYWWKASAPTTVPPLLPNYVMVCCPNSKICLASNLFFPFRPSYASSFTGKNAFFSPQGLVSMYFAVENEVSQSCKFRFFSGAFELPTVLFRTLVVL